MPLKAEAIQFTECLQNLYLEQRDMEHVLSAIDEKTSWIGTGRHEICKNLMEAAEALFSEKREYSGSFTILDRWIETELLAPDVCLVYGELWAKPDDPASGVAELHNRISAVCVKTEHGFKLRHLHMSNPDGDLEAGEFFAKKEHKREKKELLQQVEQTTKALHDRNWELEALIKNVPGGVHRCANNKDFTLISMSGGFLDLFGYSEEEIKQKFENCFMNMIYEPDRAGLIQSTKEQTRNSDMVEFEYRVMCKNGSLVWILDRGRLVTDANGEQSFFCMLIDITKRKEQQEELRLSLERHQVIMDQSTDIIFEWDIATDAIQFSSNWEKKFGYHPVNSEISTRIPASDNIHPEDMPAFLKIMRDTLAGVPYSETEFRIRNASHRYIWCRIRATTQFDRDGCPVKAVGVILDIDNEKFLLDLAQRDSLTKLFNKSATKARIGEYLNTRNSDSIHALMIIDIDNFKMINDNFGHLCGDIVLTNIATGLRGLFRSADIIGRIGGDEFLVFLPNVRDCEFAVHKAQELLKSFREIPMDVSLSISCSIGISIFPHDADNYLELFQCADCALYSIKNNGKGGYAIFNDAMQNLITNHAARTAVNEKIDSEKNGLTPDKELMEYLLHTLYNSMDTKSAISRALKMIGETFDVSRIYVLELSEDGSYCRNTHEWCSENIIPKIQKQQQMSFNEDLAGYLEMLEQSDIFYAQNIKTLRPNLRDVLEAQGIVAVLQSAIRDNGHFRGLVGFEECRANHYWTREQIDSLSLAANILSTFLVRKKQEERFLSQKNTAAATV